MSARNLDRDMRWLTLPNSLIPTPAGDYDFDAAQVNCNTDGIVWLDVGQFQTRQDDFGLGSTKLKGVGMFMVAPQLSNDGDWGVYRLKGTVLCGASTVDLVVVAGIPVAVPDAHGDIAANAGQAIAYIKPICSHHHAGNFDETVCIKPFGTIESVDYSARPVFFGVLAYNTGNLQIQNTNLWVDMSAQRLAVPPPRYNSVVR